MLKSDAERIAKLDYKGHFYDERFPVFWNDVDMAVRASVFSIKCVKSSVKVFHTGAVSSRKIGLDTRLALFYGKSGLIGFVEKWSMHPRLIKAAFFIDTIFHVIFARDKAMTILRAML